MKGLRTLDFLSKKHEYTFLNNQNQKVRVHVRKVNNSSINMWSEGKSKKYRDCINLIESAISKTVYNDFPPIIIVSEKKLGHGAISSYDHIDDIIYLNSYFHTSSRIDEILSTQTFAATSFKDIFCHELAHKRHWDAVKGFYKINKNVYNNIIEAKKALDSDLEAYLSKQEFTYLQTNVSYYAATNYRLAKKNNSINSVNEVIAEVLVLDKKADPNLIRIIERELSYEKY